MASLNEHDMWLKKANNARQEAVDFLLPTPRVPALLKDQMPLTDKGVDLKEGADAVMSLWKEIADAYTSFINSPWDESLPLNSRFIDWKGYAGPEKYGALFSIPPSIPCLRRIKCGEGVDPADKTKKPYILFAEVESVSRQAGVGGCWEIEREYRGILAEWTKAKDAGDEDGAKRLHDEAHAILFRQDAWIRDWQIRTAGPNADKVKRFHALNDDLQREMNGQADGFMPKAYAQKCEKLRAEIDQLRKELGL